MKKHFSTFLIIAGIVIIAIPLVGRYMAERRQNELMAEMESFLGESSPSLSEENLSSLDEAFEWSVDEGNQEELAIGMEEAVATVDELTGEVSTGEGNLDGSQGIKAKPDAIGIIEIDKIDIRLPVAEGADLATLKFSLGHMPETASLGAIGNAAVAGHRSHSFGSFFNRLDEVAVGDEIVVTVYGGDTYTYEVYETLVVEPDDVSVLRGSSNHRVLTLITCTPIYTSTHRLIVHAVVRDE